MSPHALSPGQMSPVDANGTHFFTSNGSHAHTASPIVSRSYLSHTAKDELHDLLCIGFGPASLAIAIALHDGLDGVDKSIDLNGLHGILPKVAFLEKQSSFSWHSGMLIEGTKMQISFIKDMATLRNPRSQFTFLNYLHEQGRLVEFTNLDTFLPQRLEFEHYLKWCAGFFDEIVEYGEEVVDIVPCNWEVKSERPVDSWIVTSRNTRTGSISKRRTRNVVVATGGQPRIPALFQSKHPHPNVIHSSQYTHEISKILPNRDQDYTIAVIGSGQSAAEVFENLHSRYPNAKTNLIIKGAALRPSDDSPLCVSAFNERTAAVLTLPLV
jgi:L-ornithine N5-monooxygenase